MAFEEITTDEIAAGQPVTNGLLTKIKNSLDSNKAAIEASTSVLPIEIYNSMAKRVKNQLPVGTIVWGDISTTLNQSGAISDFTNGEWWLCNGQDGSSTDYAATLPDVRGRYLRMINHSSGNNPDGEKALKATDSYKTGSHLHTINHDHGTLATGVNSVDHYHTLVAFTSISSDNSLTSSNYIAGSRSLGASVTDYDMINSGTATAATRGKSSGASTTHTHPFTIPAYSGNSGSTGGNETSPVTVHENCFIKVNEEYLQTDSEFHIYKVTRSMQIKDVIVTPEDDYNGTGGTFTLDVEYGNSLDVDGTWTSLLSGGVASVLGGTGQSADAPTVDATTLVAGQWVRVKITGVAAKQEGIHIYVSGEPA